MGERSTVSLSIGSGNAASHQMDSVRKTGINEMETAVWPTAPEQCSGYCKVDHLP
jgi:hypothetical protein